MNKDIELSGKDLICKLGYPVPFELSPPWDDYEFSRRLYEVVHDWGIPTEEEVAFIAGYIESPLWKILDLACGAGRHSLGLAENGFMVTGLEIGGYPIDLAKSRATEMGLEVEFLQQDIKKMSYNEEFNLAFLICGQLGHFSPADCRIIFKATAKALKKQGIFILHLTPFTEQDRKNDTLWYIEKSALYFKHPSLVHREQYYLPDQNVKLIRDFAIDSITEENRLLGVSEKEYTTEEIIQFAEESGLTLPETFGDYDKMPLSENSPQRIYIFNKK